MDKKPKRNRRMRSVLIATLIIIVSGVLYTLLNPGQVIAEEILGELVQRQTNGYYSLKFNDIHVDILEREIRVADLYLQADSSKISEETGLNTVYEVELSELIINIKSLYKFYIQKKLEIESMRIVDPEIRMQQIGQKTTTSFSFETGNLYKAISDYLTVLKVDYFRIQDGDLNYNTDQFTLGNIDFQIQNLLLDSVVRNDVFYSEKIFLEVQNQKFFLPDSIHEIEFDRFVLSTQDSILRFENLSIHPTQASGVLFEDNNEVNVYDIHIPELSLRGIDYQSAYRDDHLVIDALSFTKPIIFIDDESHGKEEIEKKDNSLLNLLFTVFHKIDIGKLSIEDAEIDIKINNDKTYQRIKSEETSISFYNITLDTSNYRFRQRAQYFENVEISLNNYDYILPDSIHEVRFDALNISSKDSLLSISNLKIDGSENNQDQSFINLNVPSIDLYGFVYNDIIDKHLTVKDLLIDRVYLQYNKSNHNFDNKKTDLTISSIYTAIAPFFKEIEVGQLTIGKAELDLPDGISVRSATLDLEGFELNPSTKSMVDLFEISYIALQDILIDRDSIRVDGKNAKLSHDLTEIELLDWSVTVNSGKLDLDGAFQSLNVIDLNPDSLLHGNFMTFRKAFIESPRFDITRLSSSDTDENNRLGIEKEIVITNGSLSLKLDSMVASVDSIDVDFYLGDSIAVHDIHAKKITSTFNNLNHELKLHQLSYDTLRDEMRFLDIDINPINITDSSQTLLIASVPEFHINGFVQDQFFDHNELIAKDILIDKPEINLHIVPKENQQKNSSDLKVRIENVSLNTGEFALSGISDRLKELLIFKVNSRIARLNYPESNSAFYADSVRLDVASILPDLLSGDQASIGNLAFNSVNNTLRIDSIQYQKANESLALIIQNTTIDHLAIKRLLEDGEIMADGFTINSPRISLIPSNKQNAGKNPSFPINLKRLNLNNLSISYIDTLNKKTYEVSDVTLTLDGIDHKGELDFLTLLKNTDDFALSGSSLHVPIDQFYAIKTADYSFHSNQQKLTISNVHLDPRYSKTAYTKFLVEQKDWFEASIDNLVLHGVNVIDMVNDSIVQLESLSLDGADLFVYRDKHLPFPEDQIGLLPTEQILSIPYPIQIDTISFHGNVAYEEQPDDFEKTGTITFDNMHAQITDFTNTNIQQNTMMRLRASGQIVEQGSFTVDAHFEMDRPDQRFNFKGLVKNLPLDSLNKMLGPVASVNIKSGFAEKIEFQFQANDSLAVGDMTFRYKDLKLQVLNRKKHETDLGSGLMSFFANTFVIRTRNPRFLFPRKGTIYQKRDTTKAIFSYWGKSILSGAVSSVGIHKSDREEKKDAKAVNKKK